MEATVVERPTTPALAAPPSAAEVPLERLEADLMAHASVLAAATGRWLGWLADYDRRRGWAAWGCRSAAHWLSMACGMSLRTGRDHVRVAHGLQELPIVRAALAAGELSFSKARALTRLERPIDEDAMVELARTATAAQLDRIVAGHRQIDSSPTATCGSENADCPVEDGGWSNRRYRHRERSDGTVEVSLIVPADVAEMIDAAVNSRVDELLDRPGNRAADATIDAAAVSVTDRVRSGGGWAAIRADAAIDLLGGSAEPHNVELDIDLTITASAAGGSTGGDPTESAMLATTGARLPTEVVRRYGCDATARLTVADASTGAPIGIGRRTRIVPRWLRRRLERRDRHTCRFPSCSTVRRLHAHHIVHWADGGPTDLDNLLLLCSFHHHLVHEGGWRITGTANAPTFRRPDGTTVASDIFPPARVGATTSLAPSTGLDPTRLAATAGAGDRYDHEYVVDVAWSVNERFRGTAAEHVPAPQRSSSPPGSACRSASNAMAADRTSPTT